MENLTKEKAELSEQQMVLLANILKEPVSSNAHAHNLIVNCLIRQVRAFSFMRFTFAHLVQFTLMFVTMFVYNVCLQEFNISHGSEMFL